MGNHTDQCPKWAEDLILQIRLIEVSLGNLRAPEAAELPADKDWKTVDWEDLSKKVFSPGAPLADDAAEGLFAKVAKGLTSEGYSPEEIAGFINNRVKDPASRLKYCSAEEVIAAI